MTLPDAIRALFAVLVILASTRAAYLFLRWWYGSGQFQDLTRRPFAGCPLEAYEARRDALAEADPDFLTAYAKRLAAGEQVQKRNPSAA